MTEYPELDTLFDRDWMIQYGEQSMIGRLTELQRMREGDAMPTGWGIAWPLWDRAEFVIAPLPWNLILGLVRRLYFAVRRNQGSWLYQQAFEAGIRSEREAQKNREIAYLLMDQDVR